MPQPLTVRDDYSATPACGKKTEASASVFYMQNEMFQACSLRRRAMKPTNARPASNMP